jgi:TRAP-type transport system periplasmic protein
MTSRNMKGWLAAALLAVGATGSATAQDARVYQLTMASLEPVEAPSTKAVQHLAELVAERSEGRLKINHNPGGTLGNGLQIMEGVSIGTVDMVSMVLEWYAPFVNDVGVYGMGFTFRDTDHFKTFIESEIFDEMKQRILSEMNVRVLAANWIGLPRVLVSQMPVQSPADIAGISMRVPEIETYLMVWRGLGTNPTRVAWPEVYLALRTGTVDAAEGPLDQMYATKFFEAAPNITLTNHLQQAFTVGVNEDVYANLPDDLKEILANASIDAGVHFQELVRTQFETDRQRMLDEGATISEIDTGPFQEMLKPVIEEAESTGFWTPGLYDRIQALE